MVRTAVSSASFDAVSTAIAPPELMRCVIDAKPAGPRASTGLAAARYCGILVEIDSRVYRAVSSSNDSRCTNTSAKVNAEPTSFEGSEGPQCREGSPLNNSRCR